MAAVTAIAAVGLAVSIGTTANSFAQASQQQLQVEFRQHNKQDKHR